MPLPSEFDHLPLSNQKPPTWMLWRAAAIVAIAGGILIIWLSIPFVQNFSDEPSWRSDGIVTEVVFDGEEPRSDVASVGLYMESFPWAFQPHDSDEEGCRQPRFRIAEMPERGRTYAADEQVSITIEYKAPGCTHVLAGFVGRFERGSPWYRQVCPDCTTDYADGKLVSQFVRLDGERGTVRLVAVPGINEPIDPVSPAPEPASPLSPSVEGMRLCQIELRVSDGMLGGSESRQTIYVDCKSSRTFYPKAP